MTDAGLFHLRWAVARSGYKIEYEPPTEEDPNSRSLLNLAIDGYFKICAKSKIQKEFAPFTDTPALAREFSQLRIEEGRVTNDDALRFANQYGLLYSAQQIDGAGESLTMWAENAVIFKRVFSLIDSSQGAEARRLFNNFNLSPQMSLQISQGHSKNKRRLEIQPKTLFSAMCLMLSEEITQGIQMQPCALERCPSWFPIRTNRKFCSNACKQKAYRENSE